MPDLLRTLIRNAAQARRENRYLDARRDLVEAIVRAREASAKPILIAALKGLGQIERDEGDAEVALALYQDAAALCRTEDDSLLLAHTIRHVGDIHYELGNVEKAEPCYREALAIYRADDTAFPLDLANAIRPMALLLSETDRAKEARPLWEEARRFYQELSIPEGVRECADWLNRSDS